MKGPVSIAMPTMLLVLTCGSSASFAEPERALTLYAARVSSERTWQNIITDPLGANFADAYLVVAAASRSYAERRGGALQLEAEMQIAYNFGVQHHWEINGVPIAVRWNRFPWSRRVATSVAFGLGLSWTTEVPEFEVEFEGQSQQWLIYWMAELAAGPVEAPWRATLRLHHRSDAWGLMGEDGGVNAVGIGIRYVF